jgi:integrase
LFQRKDGRWVGQLLHQGRFLRKYGRSQAEVKTWLLEIRGRLAGGVEVDGRSTLREFLDHWVAASRPNLRPTTQALYSQVVRDHVAPAIGGVRLGDLRPDHLQRLYADLEKGGCSVWTRRKVHVVLHRSLGQAVRWGLTVRNVAGLVDAPRAPAVSGGRALTLAQVQSLLVAASGQRIEALLYVAVTTGLRQGEMLGLQWADIDWQRSTLAVRRALRRLPAGGGLVLQETKTGKVHQVSLGADGLETLRLQRRRIDEWRRVAGGRWRDQDLVFPSSVGTPLEPRRVYGEFRAVLAAAGLPAIRFHDLRHTAATLLLQQRVPAKVVQERLGHSSIGVTLNVYAHVIEDMQAEAAATIEAAVRPIVAELPGRG